MPDEDEIEVLEESEPQENAEHGSNSDEEMDADGIDE